MNEVVSEYRLPGGQRLQVVRGDLTEEQVDAIVNAANAQLQHGGGVAGAISRKGGPQIQEESDEWVRRYGPVAHARPVYTKAGALPCRYVIHAVGPVWGSGDEDSKLASAVQGSLRTADQLGLVSIAIPAISTGIFGFPKQRAAGVILAAIQAYFAENLDSGLEAVRLTIIDHPTLKIFTQALESMSGSSQAGE